MAEIRPATVPGTRTEPAPVVRLAGQFQTAAAALVCAGALNGSGDVTFGRSVATGTWWVFAEATLLTGREIITATRGRTFVQIDDELVPDKGWGPAPTPPSIRPIDPPTTVDVLTLIRTAGLHPYDHPAPDELVVLLPGSSLPTVVQRALDLTLEVSYRLVRLTSLSLGDDLSPAPDGLNGTGQAETTMFDVRLRSATSPLPRAFLTALDQDPCVLPCRHGGDQLLIQYRMASPLPDQQLTRLAERDPLDGSWVLAEPAFGCTRLHPQSEFHDGAGLVRLADRHQLTGIDPGWAALTDSSDPAPEPPVLRLIPAHTRGVAVDAALLDDSDLRCLPMLLEGTHLADLAMLIRGRDRHLLVAPGGLLERLPIGEPLYRLGPSPLYLPLGYRTQPLLPPSACQALFSTDPHTGIVLQPTTTLAFSLDQRKPIWTLWAGPTPPVDRQLPPDAHAALAAADAESQTPPAPPPDKPHVTTPSPPGQSTPKRLKIRRTWRDDVFDAENSGNLVHAAELLESQGELRRAAHLYELAARTAPQSSPTRNWH